MHTPQREASGTSRPANSLGFDYWPPAQETQISGPPRVCGVGCAPPKLVKMGGCSMGSGFQAGTMRQFCRCTAGGGDSVA